MINLTVAEAKAHLRVTTSSEDSTIGIYVDAAVDHCQQYCDRQFGSTLPASVKAAALLMVGELFANREVAVGGSISLNPTIKNLLQPFRRYGFGLSETIAVPGGLDAEGLIGGDTWSRQWAWKNEDGTAINVTGYTGTIEFLQGETVVLTKALAIVVAGDGTFNVTLSASETGALVAGDYWYRVRVTNSGVVTTLDRKLVVVQ